ncbi:MAG: Glutamate--tRNA ligase [Parcubacteria group bacterium Greene0416_79]|nr:MAG: Glutamate--tRNA ligase [Parcubacteria group bacterium Greene0416_79]
MKKVVTRFPPSPTGNLHIGGARTALFNYLFAKHLRGKMYLRLEDTDEERSRPEYEKNILDSLAWLGLPSDPIGDRPFWRQSERKEIYRNHLKTLLTKNLAYHSKETEGERAEVIRFRNPSVRIAFDDLIRGGVEFDTSDLGDFVIARSEKDPLYHLAAVVDDYEMGVTHVIRGEDHISNTPRQILLLEAFGFPRPEYAHIPLILAPDRRKLSKRHGAVAVTEYKDRGYLPEALVNYLALLGWNPGTEEELFSLEELIARFELAKVQKGGAIFNEEKLRFLNRAYLRRRDAAAQLIPHLPKELVEEKTEAQVTALSEMFFERVSVFGDIRAQVEQGEFEYLLREPRLEKSALLWKGQGSENANALLKEVCERLQRITSDEFVKEKIREAVLPYAEKEGKGNVLWPMRVALSGKEKSPDPFTLAAILGKEETLRRLKNAEYMLK